MDNSDYFIYYVVEFIKRGRIGIRSIDIVPYKWLSFDPKEKKIKCLFLEPPYDEKDFQLLQKLIEMNADAPANWSKYNVKIVSRASEYFVIKFFQSFVFIDVLILFRGLLGSTNKVEGRRKPTIRIHIQLGCRTRTTCTGLGKASTKKYATRKSGHNESKNWSKV